MRGTAVRIRETKSPAFQSASPGIKTAQLWGIAFSDCHRFFGDVSLGCRLNALRVTLAPKARSNKPKTAIIGECSSRASTTVKKPPKAKKLRPHIAMPTRCTLVALGEPFQSKASTLLAFKTVSGQSTFRCLVSTSSNSRACWSWCDWRRVKLSSAGLCTIKSSLYRPRSYPKMEAWCRSRI
jgi:hypothetical protein